MVVWSQYLQNVADFMNTTATQAGVIMSLMLIISMLVVVLIVTRGKWAISTMPITALFSILTFTYIGWFPVWTGSVIALVLVIFVGYIFSKFAGG